MKEELVFYERQQFNKWWIILLLVVINGFFIYVNFGQLANDKSLGNNPVDNVILVVVSVLLIIITIGLFFSHLDTMIDKDGVYYRFFPFHLRFKCMPWDYISEFEIVNFFRTKKFGGRFKNFKFKNKGHGIHFGFRRRSYSVSGNYGLQLTLNNNRKILIGTQTPEELEEFLNKLNAERKQK